MEYILAIPLFVIPLIFTLACAHIAKCSGRKFWVWFCISVLLPVISLIILISLPDRTKQSTMALAYETDEFGMYH
jgi:hypothetical protein